RGRGIQPLQRAEDHHRRSGNRAPHLQRHLAHARDAHLRAHLEQTFQHAQRNDNRGYRDLALNARHDPSNRGKQMGQLKTRRVARAAMGASFNIPGGDLDAALNAYSEQSGIQIAVSIDAIKGVHTHGVAGNLSSDMALDRILKGTGLIPSRDPSGVVTIVPGHSSLLTTKPEVGSIQLAQATTSQQRAAVETVTVTSSKLGGADVQSIPIAITALSQEQLTATQTAGGPDLVKQVPNLTFTKTNFTGYSIQVRGIGTQAISVATDPAV